MSGLKNMRGKDKPAKPGVVPREVLEEAEHAELERKTARTKPPKHDKSFKGLHLNELIEIQCATHDCAPSAC